VIVINYWLSLTDQDRKVQLESVIKKHYKFPNKSASLLKNDEGSRKRYVGRFDNIGLKQKAVKETASYKLVQKNAPPRTVHDEPKTNGQVWDQHTRRAEAKFQKAARTTMQRTTVSSADSQVKARHDIAIMTCSTVRSPGGNGRGREGIRVKSKLSVQGWNETSINNAFEPFTRAVNANPGVVTWSGSTIR